MKSHIAPFKKKVQDLRHDSTHVTAFNGRMQLALTSNWTSLLSMYWIIKLSWEAPWPWTEPALRQSDRKRTESTPPARPDISSLRPHFEATAAAVIASVCLCEKCFSSSNEGFFSLYIQRGID